MSLLGNFQTIAAETAAAVKGTRNAIAERKAFLSKKKLEYHITLNIDEPAKKVTFSDMLKESGAGLTSGDSDSVGFGFKKETFKTGVGGRQGSIQEQSTLFGKTYNYSFDFGAVRKKFEEAAQAAGFSFEYSFSG